MALFTTVFCTLFAFLNLSFCPDSNPKESAVGNRCSGLSVTDGSVSCYNKGRGSSCEVFCGGKYWGIFKCNKDGVWSPQLPECAKPYGGPTEDSEELLKAQFNAGCPDIEKCIKWCRSHGKKRGECVGSPDVNCKCT